MINGSYSLLYIKWLGQFTAVGCLTSDSFSESVEMIDSMSSSSSRWKTSVPTNQSYNISFEGLVTNNVFVDGEIVRISLDVLRNLKTSSTLIEWKTQDSNSIFIDSGFGYITSLSKDTSTDEFITFSATIEGFGAPSSSSTSDFNLQNELQYTI